MTKIYSLYRNIIGLGLHSDENSLDVYQTRVTNIIGLSITVLSLLLGLLSSFKLCFLVGLFTGLLVLALFLFDSRVGSRIILVFGCSVTVFVACVFDKYGFGVEN